MFVTKKLIFSPVDNHRQTFYNANCNNYTPVGCLGYIYNDSSSRRIHVMRGRSHITTKGGTLVQADKKKMMRLLKTARGQMDGILKMMEEDRYCIDISHQLMATEAILNKVNKEILTAHLKNCVANAETQEEKEEKIDELVSMLGRILK